MNVHEVYSRVNITHPCSQTDFLCHLDDALRSFVLKYGEKNVFCGGNTVYPSSVEDSLPVYTVWILPAVESVLAAMTGEPVHTAKADAFAEHAYRAVSRRRFGRRNFPLLRWH